MELQKNTRENLNVSTAHLKRNNFIVIFRGSVDTSWPSMLVNLWRHHSFKNLNVKNFKLTAIRPPAARIYVIADIFLDKSASKIRTLVKLSLQWMTVYSYLCEYMLWYVMKPLAHQSDYRTNLNASEIFRYTVWWKLVQVAANNQ